MAHPILPMPWQDELDRCGVDVPHERRTQVLQGEGGVAVGGGHGATALPGEGGVAVGGGRVGVNIPNEG